MRYENILDGLDMIGVPDFKSSLEANFKATLNCRMDGSFTKHVYNGSLQ